MSRAYRTEEGGRGASTVAAIPRARGPVGSAARVSQPPGLVADGRDMGTVVFPDAPLKFFLTASAEERAERRYKQLIAKGENVSLPRLLEDIEERDERDQQPRCLAPGARRRRHCHRQLPPCPIDEVFDLVMQT